MSIETKDLVAAIRKHPIGFAGGVAAVALAAASYLRSGAVGELEAKLEEVTAAGSRQQANLTNAVRLDEQLAAVTTANTAIAGRAVDSSALATNLQYFYELEAALGVKLIELRQGAPAPRAKGATYLSVPYTLAIEAPYDRVVQFLRALEGGARYVRFVSVTLQPRAADAPGARAAGTSLITLSLSLELLGSS